MQRHIPNVLVNNVAVLPAELTAETADGAVLAAGLEAEDTERLGDDHALLVVVGRGDTLEGLQAVHGGGTTLSLVRDHATDGAPEHLGRRTVVPWATARGVETGLLAEEGLVLHCWTVVLVSVPGVPFPPRSVRSCAIGGCVSGWVGRRTLRAEELARDVELLAADNNNLLAVQKLLGDSGGQAAEKVALAVDDNLCISISYCCSSPPPTIHSISGVVCVRAIAARIRGMRTTGSKVDILLRLVRVVNGLSMFFAGVARLNFGAV